MAQTMSITATFQLTKGDIIRSGYLGLLSRPLVLALCLGFFVGVPWVTALVFVVEQSADLLSIASLFVLPLLAIVFFSLIPLWVTRGARSLDGTHTYDFSEDGIHLVGPGFDNRIDWAIVTRCYGFGLGLLFVSGKAPILSVPARSLSPAAKTQLRRMIVTRGVEVAGTWKRGKSEEE
jgi:hypothetical protein